jgi:hypothetical protein
MKLIFLVLASSLPALAAPQFLRCPPLTTTCTTSWPLAKGDLITVTAWFSSVGGGPFSDNQSNPYTLLSQGDTYHSHKRTYSALASSPGPLTVTFLFPQENVVILTSPGYIDKPVLISTFNTSGTRAICPPAPLSLTTPASSLLLSSWVMDAGPADSCTSISGTKAAGSCGSLTGQVSYELATPGTHTQQFSISPTSSGGNTNCDLLSFPSTTPDSPVLTGIPMASQLGDLALARVSDTVLSIGGNCSSSYPCSYRIGDISSSVTSGDSLTLSGGSGIATLYIDPASRSLAVSPGNFDIQQSNPPTLQLACGHCAIVPGAIPPSAIPLYSWQAINGVWGPSGSDLRAFLSSRRILSGTGVTVTETGSATAISVTHTGNYITPLIPGPDTTRTIPGTDHGASGPCALWVGVYDNSSPRKPIEASWTVDPNTCDIQVNFAQPQGNYYVVVMK